MRDYAGIGQGVNLLFIGAIVSIFSVIPFIGGVVGIVALVLMLLGLNTAMKGEPRYGTAFYATIASIVISAAGIFVIFLAPIAALIDLFTIYIVCATTADILREKGDSATASSGMVAWNLILICQLVAVVGSILVIVALAATSLIMGIISLLGLVVGGIASIVASILYLIFLHKAQASLQS